MEETADWLTHCTDLMNDKGKIAPATPGLLIGIIIRLWNLIIEANCLYVLG